MLILIKGLASDAKVFCWPKEQLMPTRRDLEFVLGEHWDIDFECNDGAGSDINITGATINWVLKDNAGVTVMTRTVGSGITITSGSTGACNLLVTPTHQSTATVASSTKYNWTMTLTTTGGTVSRQAEGAILVRP